MSLEIKWRKVMPQKKNALYENSYIVENKQENGFKQTANKWDTD